MNISYFGLVMALILVSSAEAKECFKALNPGRISIEKQDVDGRSLSKNTASLATYSEEDQSTESSNYKVGILDLAVNNEAAEKAQVYLLNFLDMGDGNFGVECDGGHMSATRIGEEYLILQSEGVRGEYLGTDSCGESSTANVVLNRAIFEKTSCE